MHSRLGNAASLASSTRRPLHKPPVKSCDNLEHVLRRRRESGRAKLPPDENHCFNLLRPNTGFTIKDFCPQSNTTWRNLAGQHSGSSLQLTKITQCKKYFCFIVCWNKILQIRLTNFLSDRRGAWKSLHGHCWVLLVGCFYDRQSPSELRENTQVLRD